MIVAQLALLASRRFLPLLLVQALSTAFLAFVVTLLALRYGATAAGENAVALAACLVVPVLALVGSWGYQADRRPKAQILQWCLAFAIGLGFLIAAERSELRWLALDAVPLGLGLGYVLVAKVGSLGEQLEEDQLVAANGWMFVAGGLGLVAGVALASAFADESPTRTMFAMGLGAAAFLPTLFLGPATVALPETAKPDSLNPLSALAAAFRAAREVRGVRLSILGLAWAWFVAAALAALAPGYGKTVLGLDGEADLCLVGVTAGAFVLGALLCHPLLRGKISAAYVPLAAVAATLALFDLSWAAATSATIPAEPVGLGSLLATLAGWRAIADLTLLGLAGGLYVVPLQAIVQGWALAGARGRVAAVALFAEVAAAVAAVALAVGLLALGVGAANLLWVLAVLSVIAAVIVCALLPEALLKGLMARLFRLLYGVEVKGVDHYLAAGEKAVVVVNHTSFLDAPLLAALLPGRPVFAVNTFIAKRWWVRAAMLVVDAVPIDPTNPLAMKTLIKLVRDGRTLVIFPEGRITVTGALMKVYEGPGMIADKAEAPIVPVRLDGAQFTPFSRMGTKLRKRWFPKIGITVLAPRHLPVDPGLKGRQRRDAIGLLLYDVMADLIYETCDTGRTLFQALLETRHLYGGDAVAIEDIGREALSYNRLVAGAFVLGRRFAADTKAGENVGLLLPNSSAAAVVFFALQAFGRVPAMLNFSTGPGNLVAAARLARLGLIVTSRRFVEQARLEERVAALSEVARIVYLEDLRQKIGPLARLKGLVESKMTGPRSPSAQGRADSPAVILFTSGSEGTPKGVALSHRNILANRYQLAARIDFSPVDIVFNALPIFHSFGLTGGLLLPLLSGVRSFLYPSPLHYRIIPELVYATNATILFGTDTFLAGYARMGHAYDLYSVRYVFAGAERVQARTRALWMEKFGLRLLEGYGATECAPVIAVNTPMHHRTDTVGRLLPAIRHRLEPVPGIDQGGRLFVAGPNIMLGYLSPGEAGAVIAPPEGWYDTGDIVEVDAEGFVTIRGRAKRFAKIGGEMVSLAAAEETAVSLWPENAHAVVALADPRKGEQLVLVTDCAEASREALLVHARARGLSELAVPRVVLTVKALPLLGTGKPDYPAVKALAEAGAVD